MCFEAFSEYMVVYNYSEPGIDTFGAALLPDPTTSDDEEDGDEEDESEDMSHHDSD